MSTDFWASYLSGSLGICIGNRLDIVKTELQAGRNRSVVVSSSVLQQHQQQEQQQVNRNKRLLRGLTSWFRGAAAPILGYGALNSILFVTYNRTLGLMDPSIPNYANLAGVDLGKIWMAGAAGGLACWVVSTPTELIKCRAQLQLDGRGSSSSSSSSVVVMMDTWRRGGLGAFYVGGTITAVRDSFGYAWYFWTYELAKRLLNSRQPDPFADSSKATDVLIAGGVAGVVTWASIYPLDVVKTRLQTQTQTQTRLTVIANETTTLLPNSSHTHTQTSTQNRTSWAIARDIARTQGVRGFYRGLAICSLRAFIVNAAQWYIYEKAMQMLVPAAA